MRRYIEKIWYSNHPMRWILWPFSFLFIVIARCRKHWLQHIACPISVPIIVVGNLSVGGVGKTPLVIALAQELQNKGLKVGVVSRGYGCCVKQFPYSISESDSAEAVGDEPLLIFLKVRCPVVISPKRMLGIQNLITRHGCEVIISDDGLQHYAMRRSMEIIVVDGARGFGNQFCLPAGPLREKPSRLKEADFIIVNGQPNAILQQNRWYLQKQDIVFTMHLQPGACRQITTTQTRALSELPSSLAAVAGIGHPQRFFTVLQQLGILFTPYSFPDHHVFTKDDLQLPEKGILMTEKDAVKCQSFALDSWYCLPAAAVLEDVFWEKFWSHFEIRRLLE